MPGDRDINEPAPFAFGAQPASPKFSFAFEEILLSVLVRVELADYDSQRTRESCRAVAAQFGITITRYVKRLELEAVLQSLQEIAAKNTITVKEPRDRAMLGKALAALYIRNATTDQERQRITALCNAIGIDLEQFDEWCAEMKLPDDPERNLQWRSKDGRTVAIAEMEDSHLKNTIFFLERSAVLDLAGEILLTFALSKYQPTKQERDAIAKARTQEKPEAPPLYWALRREAARRGMTLPPSALKDDPPPDKIKATPKPVTPGARAFNFDE